MSRLSNWMNKKLDTIEASMLGDLNEDGGPNKAGELKEMFERLPVYKQRLIVFVASVSGTAMFLFLMWLIYW